MRADCFIALPPVLPEMVLQRGFLSPARSPDKYRLHTEKLCLRIKYSAAELCYWLSLLYLHVILAVPL
jgi:hypothetical protein